MQTGDVVERLAYDFCMDSEFSLMGWEKKSFWYSCLRLVYGIEPARMYNWCYLGYYD